MNTATMPQIREMLVAKSIQHNDPEIAAIGEMTKRRFFGRKARAKQVPITPEIVKGVREMKAANPDMHQRDVGLAFGIDGGRVNEILHGFRDGTFYP